MAEATQPIPFGTSATGFDALSGAGSSINAMMDAAGVLHARPGMQAWSGFTAPDSNEAVGMHFFAGAEGGDGALVYVTEDGDGVRRIYAVRADKTVVKCSDGGGTTLLAGTARPTFCETRELLIITGGGAPQVVTKSLNSLRLPGSPPDALSCAAVARRLVLAAADGTGRNYWSGVLEGGFNEWDLAFEFNEAEAQPDTTLALAANSRYLYAFGAESAQVFAPNETETFSPASTIDEGCVSGHSVVQADTRFAWLTDDREILLTDIFSYSPEESVISQAIQRDLYALSTVSDCWAYREFNPPFDLLVFVFPTAGRCWAYDIATKTWHERRGYANGLWAPFGATAHARCWGTTHLVGRSDGKIVELSNDAHDDLGATLHCQARSGFQDRGDPRHKWGYATVTARRGEATDSNSVLSLRWRDDTGAFCRPIRLPLNQGASRDPDFVVRPAGAPYRRREWELSWTAADAVAVSRVAETFDLLEI